MNPIQTAKAVSIRKFHRGVLLAKKFSPEILTGVGIATGVAAAVMASRATLKAQENIKEFKESVSDVKKGHADLGDVGSPSYAKDLAYVYTVGAIDLGKLYGPAITLGVASASCIVGAHGIMRKRNAALALAYNALEKTFTEYRARVEEEFGEAGATNLRYGLTHEEQVNEETGKKHIVHSFDPNGVSPYARFFDEYNSNWSDNANYNLLFLKSQQNYANDKLQVRGHMFLNEVYDLLGMDHTKAGAIVGWTLSKDGDNFIDFGIYNFENDRARHFVNGWEKSILLDFNVDGVIYDKL